MYFSSAQVPYTNGRRVEATGGLGFRLFLNQAYQLKYVERLWSPQGHRKGRENLKLGGGWLAMYLPRRD
jgi:hypothetical protein